MHQILLTPATVTAAGGELLAAQAAFEKIMAALALSAGADGPETWGGDSYGTQFAQGASGYLSSRSNLLRGGRDMVRVVGEFGNGLIDAARVAAGTDAGSAAAF